MLHTLIGRDRATARDLARGPMIEYLRSAAGLIKQFAWEFPAFKRPQVAGQPFEFDMATLAPDEMDAILEFAFQRYFDESGLFGTVEDAVARAHQLRRIGVDEIASLIDFGLPTDVALAALEPLAEVVAAFSAGAEADIDISRSTAADAGIAALIDLITPTSPHSATIA